MYKYFKWHCRIRKGFILLRIPVPSVGTKFDSVKEPVKSTQNSVSIFDEHLVPGNLQKMGTKSSEISTEGAGYP